MGARLSQPDAEDDDTKIGSIQQLLERPAESVREIDLYALLDSQQLADEFLVSRISAYTNLTKLRLGRANLTDITKLAKALRSCPKLDVLDLHSNEIADVTPLRDSLSRCSSIRWLDLKDNKLQSVAPLCDGLQTWTKLEYLDISCNQIDDSNIVCIFDMMRRCPQLGILYMYCNSFTQAIKPVVAHALEDLPNLQEICVYQGYNEKRMLLEFAKEIPRPEVGQKTKAAARESLPTADFANLDGGVEHPSESGQPNLLTLQETHDINHFVPEPCSSEATVPNSPADELVNAPSDHLNSHPLGVPLSSQGFQMALDLNLDEILGELEPQQPVE
eukprot:m.629011 g.629011  ORF g.629011 m.629011 type:complete len:332 (-) comp58268_c2_seq2:3074-4069(-)